MIVYYDPVQFLPLHNVQREGKLTDHTPSVLSDSPFIQQLSIFRTTK